MILSDVAEKKIVQPKIKVDAGMIDKSLYSHYMHTAMRISNVYVYAWESDFFVLSNAGYTYEIEIKVSRADYFNDFNKIEKHEVLKTGYYTDRRGHRHERQRPNKFYYAVPTGLIEKQDVPDYAGLLFYNPETKQIGKVKESPYMHKNNFKQYDALTFKMYYKYIDQRSQYNYMKANYVDVISRIRDIISDNELSVEQIKEQLKWL